MLIRATWGLILLGKSPTEKSCKEQWAPKQHNAGNEIVYEAHETGVQRRMTVATVKSSSEKGL